MSNVFIAFQANEESRPVVDAILADNPHAIVSHPTGLVKIDAPATWIRRETIESRPAAATTCSRSRSTW
jgi:phenol hydroxylase P2 protein